MLAVRVITDTERNCYAALGVVHHIWRPVPGRFKDYIAMPRPNLYQSLHTTVIHGGQPFEIQIRTQEMHRIAEEGVAAHWKYKDGRPVSNDDDQRIAWMRQLIEWSQELQEPGEFLSTLKVDLAPVEVYAFTPKGRVLELPKGATPVDFAYSVHTEVGHQCVGAKVNGQMVSLRHEIVSGDVVEILTQKGHKPSRDWLSFVKSSHAKSKIRHFINTQEREEATEMGRRLLENESRNFPKGLKKIPAEELQKLSAEYGLSRPEDLYAAVGFGKYLRAASAGALFWRAQQGSREAGRGCQAHAGQNRQAHAGLWRSSADRQGPGRSAGVSRQMLQPDSRRRYHRLCHAWPRRGGAHARLPQRAESSVPNGTTHRRRVGRWQCRPPSRWNCSIRAKDRPGLLAEITAVISGAGSNIRTLESRPDRQNARVEASLEITDKRQLETILTNIRRVKGVYGVERIFQV